MQERPMTFNELLNAVVQQCIEESEKPVTVEEVK